MTAIPDLSTLVNLLTGGGAAQPQHIYNFKDARVGANAATSPAAVGTFWSMWNYNGVPSGNTAAPGAAAVPTNGTTGALKQTNPGGGRQLWLAGVEAAMSTNGFLVLYDRLWHISGLDGTSVAAQTLQAAGLPALTRYTSGVGNEMWIEIYTNIGATARTATISYSNTTPTSGRTSQAVVIGGNTGDLNKQSRFIPVPLQDGDTGVTALATLTLSASTGTAGNFGVSVVHPLLVIPCPVGGSAGVRDAIAGLPTLPEIQTNACLAWAYMSGTSTAAQAYLGVHLVEY